MKALLSTASDITGLGSLAIAALEKSIGTFERSRPVQTALHAVWRDLSSHYRDREDLDIERALTAIETSGALQELGFHVWNGDDLNVDAEALRWAEVAGDALGDGDARLVNAHDIVEAFSASFARAAAQIPNSEGFLIGQDERRHRVVEQSLATLTKDQREGFEEVLSTIPSRADIATITDLLQTVSSKVDPASRYAAEAERARAGLTAAADHMNGLRLESALVEVDGVLKALDGVRQADPSSEGVFLGLRQTALAVKGQALALNGDKPRLEAVSQTLRGGGTVTPEAVRFVALLAADIGDGDWLRELLASVPTDDPDRAFLDLAAKVLHGGRVDPEAVLDGTTAEEVLPNPLALRIDALIETVTPERAIEAAALIDRLDGTEGDDLLSPRKQLLVGQMRFRLLRRVVEAELVTPNLDREALLDATRQGLVSAVRALAALGGENTSGHLEALVERVNFLNFVEEHEAADAAHQQVRDLQGEGGIIGAIERRDVTTPEQVVQLERQGVLEKAHRAVILAHQAAAGGNPARAQRLFGAALEYAETTGEREMALGDFVVHLLNAKKVAEASDLLADEEGRTEGPQVREAWLGMLAVRVIDERDGAAEALRESETRVRASPRSLLLLRQQRQLLVRELVEEKSRLESGASATGRRKLQLAGEIERAAAASFQILPAPQFLVDQSRSRAERGDWPQSWRLAETAVARGSEDDSIQREVARRQRARRHR